MGRLVGVVLAILYCLAVILSVLIGFSASSFWEGLIFFIIFWIVIDAVNICMEYVFTGKTSINKSLLFRSIQQNFSSNANIATPRPNFKKAFKSVLKLFGIIILITIIGSVLMFSLGWRPPTL